MTPLYAWKPSKNAAPEGLRTAARRGAGALVFAHQCNTRLRAGAQAPGGRGCGRVYLRLLVGKRNRTHGGYTQVTLSGFLRDYTRSACI